MENDEYSRSERSVQEFFLFDLNKSDSPITTKFRYDHANEKGVHPFIHLFSSCTLGLHI